MTECEYNVMHRHLRTHCPYNEDTEQLTTKN